MGKKGQLCLLGFFFLGGGVPETSTSSRWGHCYRKPVCLCLSVLETVVCLLSAHVVPEPNASKRKTLAGLAKASISSLRGECGHWQLGSLDTARPNSVQDGTAQYLWELLKQNLTLPPGPTGRAGSALSEILCPAPDSEFFGCLQQQGESSGVLHEHFLKTGNTYPLEM